MSQSASNTAIQIGADVGADPKSVKQVMSIHRYALELPAGDPRAYAEYRTAFNDTFSPEYVEHLELWLEADGIAVTAQV